MPSRGDENSSIILLDDTVYNLLPEQLKSLPISYIHCTDDKRPDVALNSGYGAQLYEGLINSGFTKVKPTEATGYEKICNDFINENDISLLEWLFEQRIETK